MRLLNVRTKNLEEFLDDDIPEYAILSHTWGEKEVTFKDCKGAWRTRYRGGSPKIDGCCRQALSHGFGYVWIDTICIDKSSSAELSEAINSMFAWYRDAEVCYAYLSDVGSGDCHEAEDSEFRRSRWFKRGWTLQELIAPRRVYFFSKHWRFIQQRSGLQERRTLKPEELISQITGIPSQFLYGDVNGLQDATVAQRMSWAAGRSTKRREDRAYSLLGLFRVNMPLLYGEGDSAFLRLQDEIMKHSDDQTLFAWGYKRPLTLFGGTNMFASSPDGFSECQGLLRKGLPQTSHYYNTNKGLHIRMCVTELCTFQATYFGRLDAVTPAGKILAIPLVRSEEDGNAYFRPTDTTPVEVPHDLFHGRHTVEIYIGRDPYTEALDSQVEVCILPHIGVVVEIYPPGRSGILDHWLQPLFKPRKSGHEKYEDNLYVLVRGKQGEDFVIKLQYVVKGKHPQLASANVQPWFSSLFNKKSLLEWVWENERDGIEAKWFKEIPCGSRFITASVARSRESSDESISITIRTTPGWKHLQAAGSSGMS